MFKRVTSSVLAFTLLLGLLPTTVFADSTVLPVGAGTGQGTYNTNEIYTWDGGYQGIRFSIIDNTGKTVMTNYDVVDVQFRDIPVNSQKIFNNKFGSIADAVNSGYFSNEDITEMVAWQMLYDNPKLLAATTGYSESKIRSGDQAEIDAAIAKFCADFDIPRILAKSGGSYKSNQEAMVAWFINQEDYATLVGGKITSEEVVSGATEDIRDRFAFGEGTNTDAQAIMDKLNNYQPSRNISDLVKYSQNLTAKEKADFLAFQREVQTALVGDPSGARGELNFKINRLWTEVTAIGSVYTNSLKDQFAGEWWQAVYSTLLKTGNLANYASSKTKALETVTNTPNEYGDYANELTYSTSDVSVTSVVSDIQSFITGFCDSQLPNALDIFTGKISVDYYLSCKVYLDNLVVLLNEDINTSLKLSLGNSGKYDSSGYRTIIHADKCTPFDLCKMFLWLGQMVSEWSAYKDTWIITIDQMSPKANIELATSYQDYIDSLGGDMYGQVYSIGKYNGEVVYATYPYTKAQTNYVANILASEIEQIDVAGTPVLRWSASDLYKITSYLGMTITEDEIAKTLDMYSNEFSLEDINKDWEDPTLSSESKYPFDNEHAEHVINWYQDLIMPYEYMTYIDTEVQGNLYTTGAHLVGANGDVSHFFLGTLLSNAMELAIHKNVKSGVWDIEALDNGGYGNASEDSAFNNEFVMDIDDPTDRLVAVELSSQMLSLFGYTAMVIVDNADIKADSYEQAIYKVKYAIYELYGAIDANGNPDNEKMYEAFLAEIFAMAGWNSNRDFDSTWFASHQYFEWALNTAIRVVNALYDNGTLDEVIDDFSNEHEKGLWWDADESGTNIGFIKYFMNSVGADGKYIFEVEHDPAKQAAYELFMEDAYGADWKDKKDTPANRFQYYGYKLMLEPIMWFVPKVYYKDTSDPANVKYVVTSDYGKYWYGTPTNWLEWTSGLLYKVFKNENTMWSYKPLYSNALYVDDAEYAKLTASGYTGSFDGNKGVIKPIDAPMNISSGNTAFYAKFTSTNVGYAVNFLFAGVSPEKVDLTTRTDDPGLVANSKGGEAPDILVTLAQKIGAVIQEYPDQVYSVANRLVGSLPAPESLKLKILDNAKGYIEAIATNINTGEEIFVTELDHTIVKYYELEIYDQTGTLVETKYGRIESDWNETTPYEDSSGVEKPSNYYVRFNNPRVIDINDEKIAGIDYIVEDWFTTTQDNYDNFVNDNWGLGETYDEYKSKVSNTFQDGTSSQQDVKLNNVDAAGDNIEKILALKLKAKKYITVGPTITSTDKISESQITKAVSTSDSTAAREWSGYKFISEIHAFTNNSHSYDSHRGCTHSCNNGDDCTHNCGGHCGCPSKTCYGVSRDDHSDNKISETYAHMGGDTYKFEIRSKSGTVAAELLGYLKGYNSSAQVDASSSETIKFGDRTISDAADTYEVTNGTGLNGVTYITTVWRGGNQIQDNVTLAKYKTNAMDAHALAVMKSILPEAYKNPTARAHNGTLTGLIKVKIGHTAWDAVTKAECDSTAGCWHPSSERDTPDVTYKIEIPTSATGVTYDPSGHWVDFEADMEVDIYAGDTSKKATLANDTPTMTPSGFPVGHSSGTSYTSSVWFQQLSNADIIKFNPYIKMSFMESDDALDSSYSYKAYDRNVYVLSDNVSQILPSNAIEVSWYNAQQASGKYGIQMQSAQWSTHALATNGYDNWRKVNQVLPGGAVYTLSTTGSESNVKVVTYNTLVDPNYSNWITSSNTYKSQGIVNLTANFLTEVRKNLEHFRMAQWVTWKTDATKAWEDPSKAVSILDGNESLNNLNNPNTDIDNSISDTKSSTDAKYRLVADSLTAPNAKGSSEGDIDIMREYHTTNVYKAFTDIQGDVYVATITINTVYDVLTKAQLDKAVEILSPVCGTNLAGKGSIAAPNLSGLTSLLGTDGTASYRIDIIGNKQHTVDQIKQILQNNYNSLYWMNEKTAFITNVVKSVERNTGNDTNATWMNNNDGKWYNEAFDGLYMVEQTTTFIVGLKEPSKRVAALDPSLCPPKGGTSGLYSMAYMSQFCLHPKSTTAPSGKADGYIGTINLGNGNIDVCIPNVMEMLYTREFYIPNANVQDLN